MRLSLFIDSDRTPNLWLKVMFSDVRALNILIKCKGWLLPLSSIVLN